MEMKDQEYLDCVRDILDHPVFQSMDEYIQHGNTTCKEHCMRVSYMSYRLCRRMGGNWRSAARAGLLHDLFLYGWHTHAKEDGTSVSWVYSSEDGVRERQEIFSADRGGRECDPPPYVAPDADSAGNGCRFCADSGR